jgi:hypothetical protein
VAELRVLDAEPAPSPDIIERLTEVCKEVEDDKVSSVAVAVVYRDGTTGKSWSTAPSLSLLIGAVERLKAALVRTADG